MRLRPRHPGVMLLALALATLLWYAKALERRERISERQLDASVTLVNVPADMVVTSEVPRVLMLRVRGPLSLLRGLEPSQTGVVIDLRGAGEGEHDFPVESRDVVVPPRVEVIAVSPPQVPLRLERIGQRRIEVRARVVGDPAPGMVVGAIGVQPGTALVMGPRVQLQSLRSLLTDPVSVDGVEAPLEALVTIRSPHPLVRILDPLVVRVTVDISPTPEEPPQRKGR